MNYIEMKKLAPSRTEEAKTNIPVATGQKVKVVRKNPVAIHALGAWLLPCLAAGIFYLVGDAVQRLDPTAGWLDIGTLSLPLFAAWSCWLGVGIAGLLPVIVGTIGRKGGMMQWKKEKSGLWQVVVYVGYIVLLCALL